LTLYIFNILLLYPYSCIVAIRSYTRSPASAKSIGWSARVGFGRISWLLVSLFDSRCQPARMAI